MLQSDNYFVPNDPVPGASVDDTLSSAGGVSSVFNAVGSVLTVTGAEIQQTYKTLNNPSAVVPKSSGQQLNLTTVLVIGVIGFLAWRAFA